MSTKILNASHKYSFLKCYITRGAAQYGLSLRLKFLITISKCPINNIYFTGNNPSAGIVCISANWYIFCIIHVTVGQFIAVKLDAKLMYATVPILINGIAITSIVIAITTI